MFDWLKKRKEIIDLTKIRKEDAKSFISNLSNVAELPKGEPKIKQQELTPEQKRERLIKFLKRMHENNKRLSARISELYQRMDLLEKKMERVYGSKLNEKKVESKQNPKQETNRAREKNNEQ